MERIHSNRKWKKLILIHLLKKDEIIQFNVRTVCLYKRSQTGP